MQLKTIFSVSQINHIVRLCLEENFSAIWIEGEISNLATPSSGHCYFSLKDANAQLRCALFSTQSKRLNFKPENGVHVTAFGKLSMYENRGDYQFIVESLEEAGDGKLQRAFELLKKKLSEEGLFDQIYKKPLPSFPKQIGIITSPTGAALRDILKLFKTRFPRAAIVIYPSLVQGETASAHIVKMIEIANARNECDALILARGGGSLEDLWAFNTENVARAIFASKIPIISAIGHEIDFTIADFVADYRAPTPSAAAVCLTQEKSEWSKYISQIESRLLREISIFIKQKKEMVTTLRLRLPHPQHQLRERIQRIDEIEQRFVRAIRYYLTALQKQLNHTAYALDAISPLATLKRGYAIALTKDKHVITTTKQIKKKDALVVKLSEGALSCTVESIEIS